MKTRLTLYLEKSVIEGLKIHARSLGLSLSKFIEREYGSYSQNPVLKGSVEKDVRKNMDWKEERSLYLKSKHG